MIRPLLCIIMPVYCLDLNSMVIGLSPAMVIGLTPAHADIYMMHWVWMWFGTKTPYFGLHPYKTKGTDKKYLDRKCWPKKWLGQKYLVKKELHTRTKSITFYFKHLLLYSTCISYCTFFLECIAQKSMSYFYICKHFLLIDTFSSPCTFTIV